MKLQERLLASAKELVRLLEESQKEHEEMIRERDRKLLGEWDHSAEEIKLPGGLGLILYVDAKSREVMGFEVSLPDGSAFQPPIDKLYKAIEAMTPPCFKVDIGREYKSLAKEAEQREAVPDKPKTRNMCTAIDALKEVFANVASEDILMVLDEFKSEVLENSYYVKR